MKGKVVKKYIATGLVLFLVIVGILFMSKLFSKTNRHNGQTKILAKVSEHKSNQIVPPTNVISPKREERITLEKDDMFNEFLDQTAEEMSILSPGEAMPLRNASAIENYPDVEEILTTIKSTLSPIRTVQAQLKYVSTASAANDTLVTNGTLKFGHKDYDMAWINSETGEPTKTFSYDGFMYRETYKGDVKKLSEFSPFRSFLFSDVLNNIQYTGQTTVDEIEKEVGDKKESVKVYKLSSYTKNPRVEFNMYVDIETGMIVRYENYDRNGLVYRHDFLEYQVIKYGEKTVPMYTKLKTYSPRQYNDIQEYTLSKIEINKDETR